MFICESHHSLSLFPKDPELAQSGSGSALFQGQLRNPEEVLLWLDCSVVRLVAVLAVFVMS